MKLIVDDGGRRRAFRLGDGVLRVGSAAEADLTLSSAGIAPMHAKLKLAGSTVTVTPVPNAPTLVAGVPISGATAVAPRAIVALGEAKLWYEPEPSRAPSTPDAAAAPGRPPGGVVTHKHESVVKTRPRRKGHKYGLPTWAIVSLVGLVLVTSIPLLQKALRATAKQAGPSVEARLDAAEDMIRLGEYDNAERRIELAEADADLSAAEEARIATLRTKLAAEREASHRALQDLAGTNYKNLLERYEREHLEGDPEPAKVRLFLKRARTFHERWPDHPERGWVERQESRFASLVDLSQPPSWRDVEWEVKVLVRSAPRDYAEAFRLLDEFLARAEGGDKIHATKIRDRFEEDRIEYHADRMAVAEREYEKGDVGAAVWWLVHEIVWSGEPAMADEAARVLTRMPNALEHLRGYRAKYPDKFEALLENDAVRRAWEKGESAAGG